MSPRAKTISDHQLVAAAALVVAERGVEQTRLTDVAVAIGLAPATLVQRFGTRAGLLDAVAHAYTAAVAAAFALHAGSHVDRLVQALEQLFADRHMVFLVAHRAGAARYSLELRKQIGYALAAAVEAGELPHCDVALHARRVQLAYYGVAVAAVLENDFALGTAIEPAVRESLGDFL